MLYVGIDVHKKRCVATIKGGSKAVLEEVSFQNNRRGVEELVTRIREHGGEARAVVESTGNYWIRVHDTLEEHGIDVLLANPVKTRTIAQARLKNDKLDSRILADLLRADLVAECYVPSREERDLRQLLRGRVALVRSRTRLRNRIHSLLAKHEVERVHRDPFTKKGLEWLEGLELPSWVDQMLLRSYISVMRRLDRQLEAFNSKLASIAVCDEAVRLLMTIPGVDFLTALTIRSEVVDVKRFSTPWKLVSYAGLAPTQRDSGGRLRRGGITKQGARWLRAALVEAAQTCRQHDGRLGRFYERIAARRGPQKAVVATAKEMLVIIWHMLMKKEPYRGANRRMVERKYKRMTWIAKGGRVR